MPDGPYYIQNGTTLEDNEFVTDQTKGLGYKKEIKPKMVNLSSNKFKDVKKIKIDEITYNQKEISKYFETPEEKNPKYKITLSDGTIKYFTSENLALIDANLEETSGIGFVNGDFYSKAKPKISDISFQKVKSGYVDSQKRQWKEEQPRMPDNSWKKVTSGFKNDDGDYSIEQPKIDDPSYKAVTSGFVNSLKDEWQEEQPKIDDPSYKAVTSGFVNSSRDEWQEEQPKIDDPSYKAVTSGFVNSSIDEWQEEQPTKPDISYKLTTNNHGYYAYKASLVYKKNGQVWWGEPTDYEFKDDSYTQIKNEGKDFTKVDGKNHYASLNPSTGIISIEDSINNVKINISEKIKEDDFLKLIINKWIKKDATEVNIDDIKDTQPNKINPKYKKIYSVYTKNYKKYFEKQPRIPDNSWKKVTSGFKNDDGDYYTEQPRIPDNSWKKVTSGFKNDDGDYYTEQPRIHDNSWKKVTSGFTNDRGEYSKNQHQILDASWSPVDSGFTNDRGEYSKNQPQILDASWSPVDSGFTNDGGNYFEEQPQILDASYYDNAEKDSYFNTVNKTYYANKDEAMIQSGITKVSDPSWTGDKVIIDGEEITPTSITKKWWYNAKDQKAPEKLYLVNNEFSFTQNIKKAKDYVLGNLPTPQTISSKNKIVIIDGVKYKWING